MRLRKKRKTCGRIYGGKQKKMRKNPKETNRENKTWQRNFSAVPCYVQANNRAWKSTMLNLSWCVFTCLSCWCINRPRLGLRRTKENLCSAWHYPTKKMNLYARLIVNNDVALTPSNADDSSVEPYYHTNGFIVWHNCLISNLWPYIKASSGSVYWVIFLSLMVC